MQRTLFALAVGAALVVACSDHDQMRSSVVMCESAAQHIKKCCGAAPPQVSCEYAYNVPGLYCDPDCAPTERQPDFSENGAQCVIAKGCVEITAVGACSPVSDGTKAADTILSRLGCTP